MYSPTPREKKRWAYVSTGTPGVNLALEEKRQWSWVMAGIQCKVDMYLGPESLGSPVTSAVLVLYTTLAPIEWCSYCYQSIDDDEPRATRLCVDRINVGIAVGSVWIRRLAHLPCAEHCRLGRDSPWYTSSKLSECVNEIKRSARVLLLLETLGLPRDLAWPITAAAYWLL